MSAELDYPNIAAIARGTIAGRFREWPVVRPEAKAILAEMERLRVRVAELEMRLRTLSEPWEAELQSLRETYDAATAAWGRDEEQYRAAVERLRAALEEWRKEESAVDCVACCSLDAALDGKP